MYKKKRFSIKTEYCRMLLSSKLARDATKKRDLHTKLSSS